MKMNDQTKLMYALEHIDHLYDLIEDNYWEEYLYDNIRSMEVILEAQLDEINKKKFRR
tara:strand:- start:12068 stop:12241 length:174 start_codon:yes stop_codon:yes gene_type:complete